MVENSINYYVTYKNILLPRDGYVDLRFFENGNIAVCGFNFNSAEIIVVVERKKQFSYIYSTEFNKSNFLKIKTSELADFLELDLNFSLNQDENPENIRAFVPDLNLII